MINTEYILKRVQPYLIENNKLNKEEFKRLFGDFEKAELKEILFILKKNNIEILLENKKEIGIKSIINYKEIKKLSNEQLCCLYKKGNEKILDVIIEKNENLIWSRVSRYSKYLKHRLEDEDLFQSGAMGLMEAVKRFEGEKGANLATYGIWWIDQRIKRDIINYGFIIRIPVHMVEVMIKINNMIFKKDGISKENLYKELKEEITLEKFELAIWLRECILQTTSINLLIGESSDSELGNFIKDESSKSIEEIVEGHILKEEIDKVLDTLTERERKVLILRFGLEDGVQRTLEEIGGIFKVTRERIRQIEAQALKRLRHASRSKKIKSFFSEV